MPLSPEQKEVCDVSQAIITDFYWDGGADRLCWSNSVYDLLYGEPLPPKPEVRESGFEEKEFIGFSHFRWYHLPANNKTWCEVLIRKIYKEKNRRIPSAINEDWIKREHRGRTAYSRFIRPTCREIPIVLPSQDLSIVTSGKSSSEVSSERESAKMLFMPFMNQEVAFRVFTKDLITRNQSPGQRSTTDVLGNEMLDAKIMQAYPDLHIRRTLEQYFYTGMDGTTSRVGQGKYGTFQQRSLNKEPELIVVDQLWLWILNDDIIVSSFPHRGVAGFEGQTQLSNRILSPQNNRTVVKSANELAALITSQCIEKFNYERLSQTGDTSKIVDKYDELLQTLLRRGQLCYSTAISNTDRLNTAPESDPEHDEAISILTSRGDENDMLIMLRDLRDELEIVSLLQDDQKRVIRDMGRTIGGEDDRQYQVMYKRLRDELDDQAGDVANLIKFAARIFSDVNQTVELKQSAIIANEAKYSLTTSRQLASESSKQGKIILLFTIVTVVFLPLSFLAAFFAIPIVEYPKAPDGSSALHLSWVCKYVFGLTAAVAGTLITLGYNFDRIGRWWGFVSRPFRAVVGIFVPSAFTPQIPPVEKALPR